MNAWENIDALATESLMHLEDNLVIGKLTARDKTAEFNKTAAGYAKGDTVDIKTRPEYEVDDFDHATGINVQGIRESKRSMKIEHLFDVSVKVTATEKRLNVDDFSEQVIRPAIYKIAEKIDTYIGTKILSAAGLYSSDDLFASSGDMALAKKEANYQQLGIQRFCLVNDTLEAKLLGADYFNTYDKRGAAGATVFSSGSMGYAMGMDFHSSLQFPEHTYTTVGNGTSTTDNGAGGNTNNQIGVKTLTIDALTGTISAGAHIRVAGCRRPLRVAEAAAATDTTVALVDPITEIIEDGAAVTVISSGDTNIDVMGAIFDGESMAMAMPILDKPSDKPSAVLSSNGYSIRLTQGYDMKLKSETLSLDCLVGAESWDPRRITLLGNY